MNSQSPSTSERVSNTAQKSCKLFATIFYPIMMGLLIFHLALPYPVYAGPEEDAKKAEAAAAEAAKTPTPGEETRYSGAPAGALEYRTVTFGENQAAGPEASEITAGRLAGAGGRNLENLAGLVSEAGKVGGRLAQDAVFRNKTWLNQSLVNLSTGKEWDLSTEDLNRPKVVLPAGLAEFSLDVTPLPENEGIMLTVKGYKWGQKIKFPKGLKLVDYDWDSERVALLTSDGHHYEIQVASLAPMMFQCNVPNFDLGLAQGVNGIIANKLRIAKRRVKSPDKSRAAQEANLNLNPRTERRTVALADGKLVQRMRENLDEIRPIDLHPDWERLSIEISDQDARLRGEKPDGKAHHHAWDTLYIYSEGDKEQIIREQPRAVEVSLIGMQLGPMMGIWTLASPESAKAALEYSDMQGSGQESVAELLKDPESVRAFYDSEVYKAYAQMPAAGLNALGNYAHRTVGRFAKAESNGTPHVVQDHYTHEQAVADFNEISGLVKKAEASAKKAEERSYLNPLRYKTIRRVAFWGSEKIRNFDLPKRVRQATTILKYGVAAAGIAGAAAGADYMLTHGQGVALAVDTAAAVQHHVTEYLVPIAKTPKYFWDSIYYSDARRLAIMGAILGLFALAKPFSQKSTNTLLTSTGIKWLFAYTIVPPQRFAANLLLAPRALDAMQKGYAPWYLFVPGVSYIPAAVNAASASIARKNRMRSMSAAFAIHGVAAAKGVDPIEVIQGLANKEDQQHLQEVANAMAFQLNHFGSVNLGKQLEQSIHDDPETFLETWRKGSQVATGLAAGRPNILLRSAALARVVATRQMLMTFGLYGNDKFQKLKNPQPPEEFSNYVVRSYLVDGALTIFTGSKLGNYANPAKPEMLAYQPSMPIMKTHPWLVLNDGEQTVLHLGASAANDFLSAGDRPVPVLDEYRPASLQDEDYETSTRSAVKDSVRMAQLVFDPRNWRENNFFIAFGIRSFTQCVTLLQGFLIWGTVLRTFEPMLKAASNGEPAEWGSLLEMDTWEKALVGQTYFIYFAPFMYRWFWAVVLNTTRVLDSEIGKLSEGFRDKYIELKYALQHQNIAKAQAIALDFVKLYDEKHLKVPKEVFDAIKMTADGDVKAWAERVFDACKHFPPVPESANETANKALVLVGGITTTVLASYLMEDSFADRPFWGKPGEDGTYGFDPNDLIVLDSFWNGTSAQDSLPVLMAKSLGNIGAVWAGGHALNMAVDGVKLAQTKPGSPEAKKAAETLAASARGAMTMPGVNMFANNPSTNSRMNDAATTCGGHLKERAEKRNQAAAASAAAGSR